MTTALRLDVVLLRPVSVARETARDNETLIYGKFSGLDWKIARAIALGLEAVVKAALNDRTKEKEGPKEAFRIIGTDGYPLLRREFRTSLQDTASLAAAAACEFLVGILEEKTLPILSERTEGVPEEVMSIVNTQRELFLEVFGGQTIRPALQVDVGERLTVVLRDRCDRLPAPEEEVSEVTLIGAPDGYTYNGRTHFVDTDGGKQARGISYDQSIHFEEVQRICSRIRPHHRERYRFTCERRLRGRHEVLILRDIALLDAPPESAPSSNEDLFAQGAVSVNPSTGTT